MAAKKRNRRSGRSTARPSTEAASSTAAEPDEEVEAAQDEAEDTSGSPKSSGSLKDPVRRGGAAKDAPAASTRRSAEAERTRTSRRRVAAVQPNPTWLAPFAVTMLILGLVYLVVYYLSAGQLPLPIGDWNLAAGFGIMVVGGGALMFWK
ncbi:cell division protein CrgA [Brachybacterium hainanense]|uniref:Cell division protein CrgA n=1 Tax=Brachybacterium hainanense TaxID=1541174 RepID=A0ABV6RFD9_9MICO